MHTTTNGPTESYSQQAKPNAARKVPSMGKPKTKASRKIRRTVDRLISTSSGMRTTALEKKQVREITLDMETELAALRKVTN